MKEGEPDTPSAVPPGQDAVPPAADQRQQSMQIQLKCAERFCRCLHIESYPQVRTLCGFLQATSRQVPAELSLKASWDAVRARAGSVPHRKSVGFCGTCLGLQRLQYPA